MNSVTSTLDFSSLPLHARPLLAQIGKISQGCIDLLTPEGFQLRLGDTASKPIRVEIDEWSVLRRIFNNGDIGLAECYRDGLLDTDDLTGLLRTGIRNQHVLDKAIHGSRLLSLGYRLKHLLRRNTLRGSARNIEAHYDLGNDFYRLWLDPSMTYSSARFYNGMQESLEHAQDAKYQRMLDFIGARPGQCVLEIGCGWGGFAEYAGKRGIRVHGLTLSHEQLAYARERIKRAGLEQLCRFELRDYRAIEGQFNHIVSIEMLEAVGMAYWPTYFDCLYQRVKPGGRIAIQSIVINEPYFKRYSEGTDFIQQYIFPGGMLPTEARVGQLAQKANLALEQVERFGHDYAETLRRWRTSFESVLPAVRHQGFDEGFIRLWRFYLAYCEAGFDENRIDVLQFQLTRDTAQ